MSREYNIAWNANQRGMLNSAVRRYNNAIRRALKAHPELRDVLPKEVSYKELKKRITTARALKNTVNRLSRITRPRALEVVRQEDGSLVTRYERHEYSVLKSMRERKKSMEAKRRGIEQPEGRVGSIEQAELSRDTRKTSSLPASAIKRGIETMERELNMSRADKARRYFSNYISALYTVFGGFEEYDQAISLIEEKILELAKDDFDKVYDALDDAPEISYIYEPQARKDKMAYLMEYWENA